MASGKVKLAYEEPQTTPDGNQIWLRTSKVPLRDTLGEVIGVLGLYDDITIAKEAETKLRLQGAALEAAANAIVITDHTGVIHWANPSFCNLTGYALDEIIGRAPGELLRSGVQPPEFYKDLWRTILSGQVWRGEIVNRRKDGTLYHEDMTITPVLDKVGSVSHFVAVKQDITGRRQAEMQIHRLNRLYAMLGGINELIVRCHDAERLFSEACRITVEEGGFRMAWVGLVDPDSREIKPVAHGGKVDGYLDHLHITVGEAVRGRGPTGQAAREGKAATTLHTTSVCNPGARTPCAWAITRPLLSRSGWRGSCVAPLPFIPTR
jgi:PAS domain S-box-containing protein